jgi:hypothetical protein
MPDVASAGSHPVEYSGRAGDCESTSHATDLPGGCGECDHAYEFSLWAGYCQEKPARVRGCYTRCVSSHRDRHHPNCDGSLSCAHGGAINGVPFDGGINRHRVLPSLTTDPMTPADIQLAPPSVPAEKANSKNGGLPAKTESLDSTAGETSSELGKPANEKESGLPNNTIPEIPQNEIPPADNVVPPNNTPPPARTTTGADDSKRSATFPRPRMRTFRPRFSR